MYSLFAAQSYSYFSMWQNISQEISIPADLCLLVIHTFPPEICKGHNQTKRNAPDMPQLVRLLPLPKQHAATQSMLFARFNPSCSKAMKK